MEDSGASSYGGNIWQGKHGNFKYNATKASLKLAWRTNTNKNFGYHPKRAFSPTRMGGYMQKYYLVQASPLYYMFWTACLSTNCEHCVASRDWNPSQCQHSPILSLFSWNIGLNIKIMEETSRKSCWVKL